MKENYFKWIDSSMVILFFTAVLLLLFFSGTLNSGYHFIDDHEMLKIHSDLKTASFVDTSIHWVKSDFAIRFRPAYFIHRVLEMKIFGDDFFALSFYIGILAAATFSLFYFGARKLKYSVPESLLLVLITFVGPQMAVWWKMGANEPLGMFFIGLSFLFLAKSGEKTHYSINTFLFSFSLVLASLCKESFVIIIPAFVFLKIWNEKKIHNILLGKSVWNNRFLVFPVLIMLAEIWAIVFVVGTNTIGYAGSASSPGEFANGIWHILYQQEMLFPWVKLLIFALCLFGVSLFSIRSRGSVERKKAMEEFLAAFIFFLLILITNLLLYAKSGMYERYLLPTTFGIAFFVINIARTINNRIVYGVFLSVILIFVAMFSKTAEVNARAFAIEGKQTNQFLSAIMKNTKANSSVVLVANPVQRYEETWSTKSYLFFHDFNNICGYPIMQGYVPDSRKVLEKQWLEWFKNKEIEDISNDPDILAFFDKENIEIFFSQSNISQAEYHNILGESNLYAVYIKNNPL